MDEHIKKEKIFKLLEHPKSADPLIGSVLLAVRKAVENLPADDVEPVRHGRWLYVCGKGTNAEYECEECRGHVCFDEKIGGSIPAYIRCPHCGAKMDGGADNVE